MTIATLPNSQSTMVNKNVKIDIAYKVDWAKREKYRTSSEDSKGHTLWFFSPLPLDSSNSEPKSAYDFQEQLVKVKP